MQVCCSGPMDHMSRDQQTCEPSASTRKKKARLIAEKAARKLKRTQTLAKKRQDATMEVVNMVLQQLLAAQDPPLQFRDESGEVVLRPLKPSSTICKKFMQVCQLFGCVSALTHMMFVCDSRWKPTQRTSWRKVNPSKHSSMSQPKVNRNCEYS